MFDTIMEHYPYYFCIILLVIGLWGMFSRHNLMKKLIGMTIFQVAVILFFITVGYKAGGTIPILIGHGEVSDPAVYINPIPHVLMLTAIVVSVATSGVALSILLLIYRRYKTLDETEIMKRMQK